MGKQAAVINLGSFSSAVAGSTIDIEPRSIDRAQVFGFGTFVATWALEVSPDGGTTWLTARDINGNDISGLTTAAVRTVSGDATRVRGRVTAFTSGTVQLRLLPRGD